MNNNEIDYILKLVLIGNSGVGKTSIFEKYCYNKINKNIKTTIGTDLFSKIIKNDNKNISLQIWDTAGQEK